MVLSWSDKTRMWWNKLSITSKKKIIANSDSDFLKRNLQADLPYASLSTTEKSILVSIYHEKKENKRRR